MNPIELATQKWNEFWFTPGHALNLAVARILVSGTALWMLLSRDLPAISGVPRAFWATVSNSFQWHYLLFPGNESLERWLQWLAVVALVATFLGVFPRVGALVAGIILVHMAPMESFQWASGAFTWSIPILGLFFVAVSPSGDSLSLWPSRRAIEPAWTYRWPVQSIRLQLCLLYFFSGYSKMIHAGPAWAAPEHMQAWILGMFQREHPVYTTLPPWVADHLWICGVMGVVALLVEFSFPLVLFSKRARMILVPTALTMHLGIVLVLNITVLYWPVMLVFVDWKALAEKLRVNRIQPQTA